MCVTKPPKGKIFSTLSRANLRVMGYRYNWPREDWDSTTGTSVYGADTLKTELLYQLVHHTESLLQFSTPLIPKHIHPFAQLLTNRSDEKHILFRVTPFCFYILKY